jgi:hypothetical protein
MILGGESTGGESQITLTIDDRLVDRWTVQPGAAFFKKIRLDPGALASTSSFAKVVASYRAADGTPGHVRLTQFTVEPDDSPFFVQAGGWNELEYSKQLQRRWRWTTGKATTFVNSGGRDLTLHISGESPLKYFDGAPHIVVRAGDQVLATQSPSSDFAFDVKLPGAALEAADGLVTIETDRTFVPNERSGVADKRMLGLRIFDFEIR